jgi:hypothetical protein
MQPRPKATKDNQKVTGGHNFSEIIVLRGIIKIPTAVVGCRSESQVRIREPAGRAPAPPYLAAKVVAGGAAADRDRGGGGGTVAVLVGTPGAVNTSGGE